MDLVCCMPTDWRSVLMTALFVMDVVLTSSRCLYSWNFATNGMGPVVLGLPSLCVRSRVMIVSISGLFAIVFDNLFAVFAIHSCVQIRETKSSHAYSWTRGQLFLPWLCFDFQALIQSRQIQCILLTTSLYQHLQMLVLSLFLRTKC